MRKPFTLVLVLIVLVFAGTVEGATNVNFRWSKQVEPRPSHLAMTADGNRLYLSTAFPEGDVYQLSPSGTIRRHRKIKGSYRGVFTVGQLGQLYVSKNTTPQVEWTLYSLDWALTEQWTFKDGSVFGHGGALSENNNLYIGAESGEFYSVSREGTLRWRKQLQSSIVGSPVIGPAGTIFQGTRGGTVYAFRPDGSEKWSLNSRGSVVRSISMGQRGQLYFGTRTGELFSVTRRGEVRWSLNVGSNASRTEPVIGESGNIYFTTGDNRLISVSDTGLKNWDRELPGSPEQYSIRSTPAVDRAGNIHVGNFRDNSRGYYCVYSSAGEQLRKRETGGVRSNMLLSNRGMVYFTTGTMVHAARTRADSFVRYSPWPMHQHDRRRTGRASDEHFEPRGSPIQSRLKQAPGRVVDGVFEFQSRRLVPGSDVATVHLKSLDGASITSVVPASVTLSGMPVQWYWRRGDEYVFVFNGRRFDDMLNQSEKPLPKWKTISVTLRGKLRDGRAFRARGEVKLWTGEE